MHRFLVMRDLVEATTKVYSARLLVRIPIQICLIALLHTKVADAIFQQQLVTGNMECVVIVRV
jgi:hypothetical protein